MTESQQPSLRTGTTGHARWVRISHWIVTVSFLTLAFTGCRDSYGPPTTLLGRGRQRSDTGAVRAAHQPKLTSTADGTRVFPSSRARLLPSVRIGPTRSSTRTAGGEACTFWRHGFSSCLASSICWRDLHRPFPASPRAPGLRSSLRASSRRI